jgi:hypothetical protein
LKTVVHIMKHAPVALCFIFILCILLLGFVQASSETFTVDAEESALRIVTLNEGDEVYGRITVVGVEESTILSYQNVGLVDFKFAASKTGQYSFEFQNLLAQEAKHVTFNYNVQHYILGFPQEYIILFVIVGLALVAVVVFVAMSPRP